MNIGKIAILMFSFESISISSKVRLLNTFSSTWTLPEPRIRISPVLSSRTKKDADEKQPPVPMISSPAIIAVGASSLEGG